MKLSPEMEHAKNHFLNYGFSSCPLTDEQLTELERRRVAPDFIYGIGCDVNAGVDFEVAVLLVHEMYGEESLVPHLSSMVDERD